MSTDKLELQKELSLLQTDSDDEEGEWRKSNSSWTGNICKTAYGVCTNSKMVTIIQVKMPSVKDGQMWEATKGRQFLK